MSVQRKSSPSPASAAPESDLETTAELPVLDVAAYEAAAAEERITNTDTWVVQSPLARDSHEPAVPTANASAVAAASPLAGVISTGGAATVVADDRHTHDDRRTHD